MNRTFFVQTREDFGTLHEGKLQLETHPFDVVEVVDDVLELFSTQADINQTALLSSIDPKIPAVLLGDSIR